MNRPDGKLVQYLHIPKCAGLYVAECYDHNMDISHFKSFPSHDAVNFATIRDPFTRLQSCFAHGKDQYSKNSNIRYFANLDDLARAYYMPHHTYHKQATQMFDWNVFKLQHSFTEGSADTVCVDSEGSMIHFAPQSLYVQGHAATCDYLLRFEHLDDDLNSLIQNQKIPALVNTQRAYVNKSSSDSKQLTTLTPIVRQLVQNVYAHDVALHRSLTPP